MGLRFERVVNADDPGLFVPHPGHSGAPTRSIGVLSERSRMYRSDYTCPELDQEIAAFFAGANLDTVAQSPYIGLIRAVDLLEKEGDGPAPANGNDAGSPGPVEAGPANDAGLPGVGGPVIESPLDPFLIHPLIPLALALGLGLFLFLVFLEMRKVWKNRYESARKKAVVSSVC